MSSFKSIYDFLNKTNDKFFSGREKYLTQESQELQKENHAKTKQLLENLEKKFSSYENNHLTSSGSNDNFKSSENDISGFESPSSPLPFTLPKVDPKNNKFVETVENIFRHLMESNQQTIHKMDESVKKQKTSETRLLEAENEITRLRKSNAEKDNYIKMMEKQVFEKIEQTSKDGEMLSRIKIKNNEMASALKMLAVEKGELENMLIRCHRKSKNGLLLFKQLVNDEGENISVLADTYDCLEEIRKCCEEKVKSDFGISSSTGIPGRGGIEKKMGVKKKKEEIDMSNPLHRAQIDLLLVKKDIERDDGEKTVITEKLKELFNNLSGTKKEIDDLNAKIHTLQNNNAYMEHHLVRARIENKGLKHQISKICQNVGRYIDDSQTVTTSLNKENLVLQSELLRVKRMGKYNTISFRKSSKKKKLKSSLKKGSLKKGLGGDRENVTTEKKKYGIASALKKFHKTSKKPKKRE